MNKHCSSAVTGQTKSKCILSEEIISGFHFITEVQSWVQTTNLAEQSSALGNLPESSSHTRAAIHVRLARLRSICSQVRSKPLTVNPRNSCTCCRISHERLSKSNHALTQQTTHMWSQPSTKQTTFQATVLKQETQHLIIVQCGEVDHLNCADPIDCFTEGSYQRQEIKTAGSKNQETDKIQKKSCWFQKMATAWQNQKLV